MPLDDTHKHHNGGGGKDWRARHEDLDEFSEAMLMANAKSCDINNKCIGCTMFMIGAKSFGKWLASHVMAQVKHGDLPGVMDDKVREVLTEEMSDMAEAILNEYNVAIQEMVKRNG